MALIKLGGLAQDVRGSLNGTVFSRNRGGAYTRTKVSPVQPITEFNTRSRNIFAVLTARWSTELDDAQRAAWVAFAAVHPFVNVFGDSVILSGIAFYVGLNRRVLEAGGAAIDDPPTDYTVPDLGTVTVTAEATSGALTNFQVDSDSADVTGACLYVFCTPILLGARSPQRNDYRLINSPDSGLITKATDIKTVVNTRFPDLSWPVDGRFSVRVQWLSLTTGAVSAPVAVNGVVVVTPP